MADIADGVWIALIGSLATIGATVIVPILLARQSASAKAAEREFEMRQRASDRKAEWERQDQLAQRVRETAEAMAIQVRRTAEDLATQADASRGDLASKLEGIHILVDGKATEALRNELAHWLREVELRRENIALKRKAGATPTAVELATVELADSRVKQLEGSLGEKLNRDIEALEQQHAAAHAAAGVADVATAKAERGTVEAVQDRVEAEADKKTAVEERDDAVKAKDEALKEDPKP